MRPEKNTGPWTQAEDQILRAGVMKYGFNKWNKVASLLARTPALCKLRYEQSVRDGAALWSSEDLVRLLELSRRFPSRFELIGSIMKRSALCCYDAYCSVCCGYRAIEAPGDPEPMDQFAVEFAKAKLENTKSRKDLKKIRGRVCAARKTCRRTGE